MATQVIAFKDVNGKLFDEEKDADASTAAIVMNRKLQKLGESIFYAEMRVDDLVDAIITNKEELVAILKG